MMSKEEVNSRTIEAINLLLNNNKSLNKALLAKGFEVKPSKFSEILNGRMLAGTDIMSALCTDYGVSPDYLLSGEGHILKEDNIVNDFADRMSEVLLDIDFLEYSAESFGISSVEMVNLTNNFIFPSTPLDFVKFLKEFPEYNYEWILTGTGDKYKIEISKAKEAIRQRVYYKKYPMYAPQRAESIATRIDPDDMMSGKPAGIPLIPYAAFAGYGSESFQDLVVEDYYIVREFKDADFLLRIKGDSMSPKFAGGDVVACKLVDGLTFWQWHKIYAICTRTQGILIKRVEEYPNNPAFVTCCSDNPQYKPFQIHEDEICAIALVLGAIVIE